MNMDPKKNEEVSRKTAKPKSDRKLKEPVEQRKGPPENSVMALFKASPVIAVGCGSAFLWGIIKFRGRHHRSVDYPLNMYMLDLRMQVCGLLIGSIVIGTAFEFGIVRLEKEKYKRNMRTRAELLNRLEKEGRHYEIKQLAPVYDPFGMPERPTYRHRIAKLLNFK